MELVDALVTERGVALAPDQEEAALMAEGLYPLPILLNPCRIDWRRLMKRFKPSSFSDCWVRSAWAVLRNRVSADQQGCPGSSRLAGGSRYRCG